MKRISTFLFLFICFIAQAQQAYYNGIDFTKRGIPLKEDLANLITSTHRRTLSYGDLWYALKITDIDPTNSTRVIQLYGYNRNSTGNDAYYNGKDNNGGNVSEWNREHTFAKSLGNPNLGESGPGADAHHLRASNVQRNSTRGNLLFAAGSGNSAKSNGGWYPGDEWKGDVARMMMYMYLRYGNRCKPTAVGYGSSANTPDDMIDLFLQWNAEDPVSQIEIQRNEYLGTTQNSYGQGNRNPFIDNPYLATLIWGGPTAENKWASLSTNDNYVNTKNNVEVYNDQSNVTVKSSSDNIKTISVFNINGQLIKNVNVNAKSFKLTQLTKGAYILKIDGEHFTETKKVIVK
jgi:endonuclease I